jgi:hypothetical protein
MAVLKKLWAGWKAFGRMMGNIVARVALSVFYFTVFVPFGLGVRWFSDPMQVKVIPSRLWRPRATPPATLADAERQY